MLLRAFRKLHAADRCYRLLIVGDGPERDNVERYLRMHGLDAFSELTGSVSAADVPALLARMDVGVAPYPELDSFYFSPLKLWEYAGAGVPIVASDTGDIASIFPHRQAALLHPAGSATKLAAQIAKLNEDPALAVRLARRARQIARAFTWDRIAARVERIAEGASRGGGGRKNRGAALELLACVQSRSLTSHLGIAQFLARCARHRTGCRGFTTVLICKFPFSSIRKCCMMQPKNFS